MGQGGECRRCLSFLPAGCTPQLPMKTKVPFQRPSASNYPLWVPVALTPSHQGVVRAPCYQSPKRLHHSLMVSLNLAPTFVNCPFNKLP